MSRTRLLYNSDTWDAATVTASSAVGDLVAGNAVNDFLARPWRSASDGPEWIKFDLGAETTITQVSLFGVNVTSGATVFVQAHTSDAWTTPDLSQQLTIATDADGVVFDRITVFLAANNAKRWWRVTFADGSNPDGYIQVGRIKAGSYYELTRNMNDGFSIEHVDPSEGSPAGGQFAAYRIRNRYRRCALDFSLVGNTQRRKMEAVFSRVGNHKPLVVCVDPDTYPSEQSMYCRLTTPLSTVYDVVNVYSQGTFVFEEITE